jgi:hypothetical protein
MKKLLVLSLAAFFVLASCATTEESVLLKEPVENKAAVVVEDKAASAAGTAAGSVAPGIVAEEVSAPDSEAVAPVIKEYAFTEEEVTVNPNGELPLGGSLIIPEGGSPVAVVIFVHGSGLSDRNETINSNTPFKDIAYGLAKKNIASLRYDKRYFYDPESAPSMSVLGAREEALDDVASAIDLVESDDRLGTNIFVLGHSLGGYFTPAIGKEHRELSGLISLAGPYRPLYEVMFDQSMESFRTIDRSQLDERSNQILDMQYEWIMNDIEVLRNNLAETPDEQPLFGVPAHYFKTLAEYSPSKCIAFAKMPIFIGQGQSDFQVYDDVEIPLWQDALKGRNNVEFHLYPGLNHLFMQTQGKRDISEYDVRGDVNEGVIADIAAFITKYSK